VLTSRFLSWLVQTTDIYETENSKLETCDFLSNFNNKQHPKNLPEKSPIYKKCFKMPFYDGIGVIAEKHAVVLDVGTAFTKVGYAGEALPRAIVRSPCLSDDKGLLSESALHDQLVAFVHKLYFEHLLVNPKDRRVVLVEALLGETRLIFDFLSIIESVKFVSVIFIEVDILVLDIFL